MAKKKAKKKVARKAPKQARRPAAKKKARKAAAAPPAAKPAHGGWAWHELMSTNVASARKFYGQVFGWSFREMPMGPGSTYTILRHAGADGGGMMQMDGPQFAGVPSNWTIYITVRNVDESTRKIEQLGGKICVPPMDIPNIGRFAVCSDPTGASFAIYTSVG